MSAEVKPPREWTIFWGQHVNGPGLGLTEEVPVIERSAYDAVVKELKLTCDYKRMAEQKLLEVVKERDEWKSEHDNLSKFAEDLRKERDEFERQKKSESARWKETKQALTAAEDHHLACHKKWNAERDTLAAQLAEATKANPWADALTRQRARIDRLERALAYAKERLEHFAPNKNAYQSCLDIILKLEREE